MYLNDELLEQEEENLNRFKQEVNQLLKQFEQTRDMMRKMKNSKGRLPF